MPGDSSMTASTRSRCFRFSLIGTMIRYQTTSAVTEPYSTYQPVFAAGVAANSLPVVIWCQNVRNVAAYVSRCVWYQRSYGIAPAHRADRDEADEHQQTGADGGLAHVRQLVDRVDRLLEDRGVGEAGLEGVPVHREDDVRDDQAERVAAGHRVPASHPVGADPALQRGHPGHLEHHQGHQVPAEQTRDPPGVDHLAALVRDGRGVVPPQPHHRGRARPEGDQQRDCGGTTRSDAAHRLAARCATSGDRGHGSSVVGWTLGPHVRAGSAACSTE